MTFNRNDVLGLFKNGVLIEIIQIFNCGTANFAADLTLSRKAFVTAPTANFYKTILWDFYNSDTHNNLGSRIFAKRAKK